MNTKTKMTAELARAIFADPRSDKAVAEHFGMSANGAYAIKTGRKYAEFTGATLSNQRDAEKAAVARMGGNAAVDRPGAHRERPGARWRQDRLRRLAHSRAAGRAARLDHADRRVMAWVPVQHR